MFFIKDDDLSQLLLEDLPYGDLTTRSLGISQKTAVLTMRPRAQMTLSGIEEAARMFQLHGARSEAPFASGSVVQPDQIVLYARGTCDAIFGAWKVAQNLVEWASGMASAAARIVHEARTANPQAVVACTRKAAPGTRAMSIKAIVSGGAVVHRTGLSETILIFPEHRRFCGPDGIDAQIARLRQHCPERSIVIEVCSREEALLAAAAGADVIQLEKFSPTEVAETRRAISKDWKGTLAAAGGINAGNAADYAASGAKVLVTSSPYQARPADISVEILRECVQAGKPSFKGFAAQCQQERVY